MANHTPEPWFIAEEPLILLNEICGNDENGEPFIIVSRNYNYSDLSNANARRIVACVNACAGIPTEDLEKVNKPTDDKFHNGYRLKLECLGGF